MQNLKEALRVRAKLAMYRAQWVVYRRKIEQLKSQYILEQDDVNCVQDSFFARLRGNYEAKLVKEKAEALKVGLELERIGDLIKEAEDRLPVLQENAEGFGEFWGNAEPADWNIEEKDLLAWCEEMELAEIAATANDNCLTLVEKEMRKLDTGDSEEDALIHLQERMEESYRAARNFLGTVGKLRVMEGTPVKTVYGERRVLDGGSTTLFLRWEHPLVELRMRELDFREIKGGPAISEAIYKVLNDLEELQQLYIELVEEKVVSGEELLKRLDEK